VFLIKVYKILISPVVLYGCEDWSVTLREEHKLKVSEKRPLKGGTQIEGV
jgi:hypothetical protein